MSHPDEAPTIFVIDDDRGVLKALARLLRVEGWRVEAFESAEAYLAHRDMETPGCLVLDVALPGIDGLELQSQLAAPRLRPVVFLTGQGDIPSSVRAMKAGAVDFLTKPVRAPTLLAAVRAALDQAAAARRELAESVELEQRLSGLTPRERQVLDLVVAGRLNKQIALDLGIVEQTVKFHRARIMKQMQARTAAELIFLVARLGVGTHPNGSGRTRPEIPQTIPKS